LKERERLEDVLRRWEDNIELCLEWDGLDWFRVAQYGDQRRAVVNSSVE
jgi:hypothetical protein